MAQISDRVLRMAMKKKYLRCAIIFIFGNAQLTFYHQYKNQCMLFILEVFFLIFTHHDAKPRFPLLIKYYDTTDLDKNADIYIYVCYMLRNQLDTCR